MARLNLREMVEQVNYITGDERSPVAIVSDFNRALLDLAPFLCLKEEFVGEFDGSNSTVPGPKNPIEVARYATWTSPSGDVTRLRKIAPDALGSQGWYYDGSNVGVRFAPTGSPPAGTLSFYYFREPEMLSEDNLDAEPEGGGKVAHALINFACAVYFRALGDDESFGLAEVFQRNYNTAKEEIYAYRRRLMNNIPKGWVI